MYNLYSRSETWHGGITMDRSKRTNKRITHDMSRTKSKGLAMVYLATSALPPVGKQQIVNTGNCSTH